MNKRIAGVLGLVVGILLLIGSVASRSWFVAPTDGKIEGFKLTVGPVLVEHCHPAYGSYSKPNAKPTGVECETEAVVKNADKNDDLKVWAAMGLGFGGAVGTLSLWYLVTGILGLIKSRANRILGWITLAFTFITMMNGVGFIVMRPDKGGIKALEMSYGVALMVLGALIGMAACVLSALGVPPKKDPMAGMGAPMGGGGGMGMGGPMGAPASGPMGGPMGGPQSGGYPPSGGMGGPGSGGMGGPGMGGPGGGMGGPGSGGYPG